MAGTPGSSTGSTGAAGTTGSSGTVAAYTSGQSQSSEQKQKIRDEVKETSEKLKSEARETARTLGENARTHAEEKAPRQTAKLEEMSNNLQHSGGGSVMSRLGRYTRNNPGIVLGGAIAVGFLLTRVMRSSSGRQERTAYSDYRGQSYQGTEGFSRQRYSSSPTSTTSATGTGLYPGDNSGH